MFDSNEKIISVSLTNSIDNILITYNFDCKDGAIVGQVKAIGTDTEKNSLGTISSSDGVQFSSGLYFGYGDKAGLMLEQAKEGISEIFKNVQDYLT